MKKYTLAMTMHNKLGDYFVQLEYLKLIDAYKLLVSNGIVLPPPQDIGVDYTCMISENPGHQEGVRYLMRTIDKCLRGMPESQWVIHFHNDVYILDFDKIDEITDQLILEDKKIAAFPWYGPWTLSTDFFIVDRNWALETELFMFRFDSGCGVEGQLYEQATKGNPYCEDKILLLDYDVTKDKQETRARSEGGARNMPWREKYRILHDHLGEFFTEMRQYGPWNEGIKQMLWQHRGYRED